MNIQEAAFQGKTDELKRFIAEGADPNLTDQYGHSLLWMAAEEGRVDCVAVLLNAKADANRADIYGHSVLHVAAQRNSIECCRLLIQYHANPNNVDEFNRTPLGLAAVFGSLGCVRFLASNGYALDFEERANPDGATILSDVIKNKFNYNRKNVVEYLLHVGIKPDNPINIPDWMKLLVLKRNNAILSTFTLKGILRKRFKIQGAEAAFLKGRTPKDIVDLIGLHVWSTRLDPKWGGSSEDDLKKMKK
jgi:ankyrin repeat protein